MVNGLVFILRWVDFVDVTYFEKSAWMTSVYRMVV
jgi:hypothetical protein